MSVVLTKLTVAIDGTVSVAEPLPAGEYTVTLQTTAPVEPSMRALRAEDLPKHDLQPIGDWPIFSREEMYGDDGR